MTRFKLLVLVVALQASLLAQGKPAPAVESRKAAVPEVVPVDQEPAHKLVFENEYVRVFSVEVAPHSETKYHQHDRDYVGVILGDADVESVRLGAAGESLKLKDGETRFTKGGFAHKAVNKGDKPFRNVTVELKKGIPFDDVTCGGSKDVCGISGGGTTHPSIWSTRRIVLRARGFVVEEWLVSGERATLDFCGKDSLVIFASAKGVVSSQDIHGEPFASGKVLWVSRADVDKCIWYAFDAKFAVLEFATPEPQGPSRQKEGARDDKANGETKK